MTTDLTPPAPRRGSGGPALIIAVGLACLVGGFLVGWFTRGDGGGASVIPPAAAGQAQPGAGTTGTTPGTTSTAAAVTPPAPPARSAIPIVVLNGTAIAGFAAQTADRAQALGYPSPSAGNVANQRGPTVVYFRGQNRAAAQRVAKDLGFTAIRPLPASGPIADAAPGGARVVVVLGPG
jgi:hypothetical protein